MSDTWNVDLRHFLDANGSIAPKAGRAHRLARHFARIVQEITADIGDVTCFPKARCRRRPNRKPCPGEIDSILDPETGAIVWACPVCGDNGSIQGWEDTFWDFSNVPERN